MNTLWLFSLYKYRYIFQYTVLAFAVVNSVAMRDKWRTPPVTKKVVSSRSSG
jgi:hypothetical protein